MKHFGKPRFRRIAAGSPSRPTLRIVNRKSHGFEVALVIEPGLLDEAFVLGIVGHRQQRRFAIRLARPAEIGVQERVPRRQQSRTLGRSLFAELDR